jgi:hypothetical protein
LKAETSSGEPVKDRIQRRFERYDWKFAAALVALVVVFCVVALKVHVS